MQSFTAIFESGQNKMVINYLEKLFVTSDAATILREMDIMHPAAKMIVMASQQQEREVGDGSNLVVVFCGELLNQAEALIRGGVHPSEIIAGYTLAAKHATEILPELVCESCADVTSADALQRGIYAAIASKQYGVEGVLAPLVAQACSLVMPKNAANFLVDNVRVCKILGQSINDSYVVKGAVIDRDTEGMIKKAENVRVAVFNCPLDAADTETKGTVLINSAQELLNYSSSEEQMMEAYIKRIIDCGVGYVVVSSTVSQLAMHFLEKNKIMVTKLMSKFELRRIAKTVGARMISQPVCSKVSPRKLCCSFRSYLLYLIFCLGRSEQLHRRGHGFLRFREGRGGRLPQGHRSAPEHARHWHRHYCGARLHSEHSERH
jgi:T-complex protein 1 subunit theta